MKNRPKYVILYPVGTSIVRTIDGEVELDNHYISRAAMQMLDVEGLQATRLALKELPSFKIRKLKGV